MKTPASNLFSSTIFLVLVFFSSCNQPQTSQATKEEWTKDSTNHFVMYAQKGVRSEKHLAAIGQQLENTQKELLRLLNETTPQRLQVYFLKDRETLTSYTGFPANGYTNTEKGVIYFVDKAPFHLAFRHEMMHALSWRLWGPPKGYWLSEGIAVFASGSCAGYPLHALAGTVQRGGKFLPFENMVDSFDFKSLEPSLQSASMVQYIYDKYGIAALKGFWTHGWQNAQQVIAVAPQELQRKWLNTIQQPAFYIPVEWDKILASGCE